MRSNGVLILVALLLIYLAVTGRYSCVTAAARCVFSGEKLCACGETGAAGAKPVAGGLPKEIELGIGAGRKAYDQIRGIIESIRGKK
jgi:hypothetical protein